MGKIDSTFKSLHFENIALPDDYEGMPAEICRNLRNQIDEIEKEIEKFEARRKIYLAILEDDEDALLAIMKNDKELLLDVINELSV